MISNLRSFGRVLPGRLITTTMMGMIDAQNRRLAPAESSGLSSAEAAYQSALTTGAAYSGIASELATATSALADLLILLGDGDHLGLVPTRAAFASQFNSVLAEILLDVSSFYSSVTHAQASIVSSVLGTRQLPIPSGLTKTTGAVSFITTRPSSSASGIVSASKNARPTVGSMGGIGCGVVALGVAASGHALLDCGIVEES